MSIDDAIKQMTDKIKAACASAEISASGVMPKCDSQCEGGTRSRPCIIQAVRWPVLEGLFGTGLLVQPTGTVKAHVVIVPDAGETPEQLLGLTPAVANQEHD